MSKAGTDAQGGSVGAGPRARPVQGEGRHRGLPLLLGLVLIPLWQSTFALDPDGLDWRYRINAATGLHDEDRFVYFHYYLGLYPVATTAEHVAFSREGARRIFAEQGDTLLMEWGHTLRYGDLGRMFLCLPSAWWRGSPGHLTVRPVHAAVFIVALMALFAAFWWANQLVLGVVSVLLLGSNPFQLHAVYAEENVFGWPISTALAVIALHLPLLCARKPARGYVWAVPIAAGLLLATVRQIRSEPVPILLSAFFAYLVMCGEKWRVRLALVGLLAGTFAATSYGWKAYFDFKFRQAFRAVEAAGGHPYAGPRDLHHMFWHPVWCGLGDFDTKYGYSWTDVAAARYALPILKAKYGVEVPEWDQSSHSFDAHWDKNGKYYKTPYELPHYAEVLRDKVLHDISHDPLWYAGILARRVWRLLSETTPVRLSVWKAHLTLPMHGLLVVPVLAFLAWTRRWMLLELLCLSLPLSLTALLIYSGDGMCWYSCYHVFAAAILLAGLIRIGASAYRRQRWAR